MAGVERAARQGEFRCSTRRRALVAASAAALATPWETLLAARGVTKPFGLPSSGRVIRVGPNREVTTLSTASKIAGDGDVVEVEAADYLGDVAVWPQRDLVIRGVNGQPRLIAGGKHAEGKGTFVLRGKSTRIENIAFFESRVPDRNGAGVRIETGNVALVGCRFEGNENGVLVGNDPTIELDITRCIFVDNGGGDGRTHNLYVGSIRRLVVAGSYFGRCRVGHLLKSRAAESRILYNRLTGEDGNSSYELEFPNGGSATVIGNLIQQGPQSENSGMVSFGAEGYKSVGSTLTIAFNTLVNDRTQGASFLTVKRGADSVRMTSNLMVGRGTLDIESSAKSIENFEAQRPEFAGPNSFDYRLRRSSPLAGRAGAYAKFESSGLSPTHEYVHVADWAPLNGFAKFAALSPGAFQSLAP